MSLLPEKEPKATLISTIEHPLETVYLLWQASRTTEPVGTAAELAAAAAEDAELNAEIFNVFEHVVASDIPVAENLEFIFLIENMPVSLREQIVRHRVGHHFGENYGCDIVPEVGRSSWWSQSMRVLNMGRFFTDGEYYVPPIVTEHPNDSVAFAYRQAMAHAQNAYNAMIECGIPPEEARQVLPLATTSRISWKLNYQSMKHVLGRRGCWIAQLGMWRGIIESMVEELAQLHPVFRKLVLPPCVGRDGSFVGCPFPKDNVHRLKGEDPEPPCPAWMTHCKSDYAGVSKDDSVMRPSGQRVIGGEAVTMWAATDPKLQEKFDRLRKAYAKLWDLNPWTMTRV